MDAERRQIPLTLITALPEKNDPVPCWYAHFSVAKGPTTWKEVVCTQLVTRHLMVFN